MSTNRIVGGLLTIVTAVLAAAASGCGQADVKKVAAVTATATTTAVASAGNTSDQKHDGWWCDEHGVPEKECSMCSAKAAAECKKKGDWCKQHDRAESQCFVCHPELKEQFAARYEAKYGKKPPKPEANGPKPDDAAKPKS